jgi:hypothetical protein
LLQPPQRERAHARARCINPLRVVSGDDQRARLPEPLHHAGSRYRHRLLIGRRTLGVSE